MCNICYLNCRVTIAQYLLTPTHTFQGVNLGFQLANTEVVPPPDISAAIISGGYRARTQVSRRSCFFLNMERNHTACLSAPRERRYKFDFGTTGGNHYMSALHRVKKLKEEFFNANASLHYKDGEIYAFGNLRKLLAGTVFLTHSPSP